MSDFDYRRTHKTTPARSRQKLKPEEPPRKIYFTLCASCTEKLMTSYRLTEIEQKIGRCAFCNFGGHVSVYRKE